jgi:hypothetical protein
VNQLDQRMGVGRRGKELTVPQKLVTYASAKWTLECLQE